MKFNNGISKMNKIILIHLFLLGSFAGIFIKGKNLISQWKKVALKGLLEEFGLEVPTELNKIVIKSAKTY